MTRLWDIHIRPVLNGWVVDVGCQTVVFSDLDTFMKELRAYLEDPEGTEARYRKDSVNTGKVGLTEEASVDDQSGGSSGMCISYR